MKVQMPTTFPFTPCQDYLVLLPSEESDSIDLGGGHKLYLPDTGKRPLNQGTVIAKGPACQLPIEINDNVIFPLHQEERLTIDRQLYYLLREELVMCHRRP